jgi:hypothetical protein
MGLPGGGINVTAHYLTIESKQRQSDTARASLADFTYSTGDAVSAEIVVSSPQISLYCLDDDAQCAIFVELPPR